MWQKNLLFTGCCVAGLAVVTGGLLAERSPVSAEYSDGRAGSESGLREVVDAVDREFRASWEAEGLEPAPRASDLTICRRLSLALTGTIPSLEEIRAIEAQPSEHRIAWWLTHLLNDQRYNDYVAERLARVFVGTDEGPFLVYRRRRFVTWLSDQLAANLPYDVLARKLIADRGLWTDSPAVNFITATADPNENNRPDPIRLARRVSRAFIGVRLDCVQCHDDHLDGEWLQSDFHGLASFFSDAQQSLVGIRDEGRPYRYKYLDAEQEQVVDTKVPFRADLLGEQGTDRERLARWVTHKENKAFTRTAVSRVWALIFGAPMFEHADSIPLDGPQPPGVEALAEDFAKNKFDLKRLIKVIAATDAFTRDSRADHEITEEHEAHWAAFPLTRLRPEQVSGSLLQSASLSTIDAETHVLLRIARAAEQSEFVNRYGDTGEDEFGTHGGTIPQRLLLMNGSLVKEKTKENFLGNAATRIAVLAPDDSTAIETAYLAVLTRRPTATERSHFGDRLSGAVRKQRIGSLEDIYWALINSTEFSWNH